MTITEQDIDRLVDALPDIDNDGTYKRILRGSKTLYGGLDSGVRSDAIAAALKTALARLNAPQPFECWAIPNEAGQCAVYDARIWTPHSNDRVIRGRFVPDEVQP